MLFTAIRVKKILYPSVTAPSKKGLEYIYIYMVFLSQKKIKQKQIFSNKIFLLVVEEKLNEAPTTS
jgi:hypothetical protein